MSRYITASVVSSSVTNLLANNPSAVAILYSTANFVYLGGPLHPQSSLLLLLDSEPCSAGYLGTVLT